MGNDTTNNPFARLGSTKLDSLLTRSTKQPTQETRNPGNQENTKPVSQEPVKPETQETRKRAAYPKKTYNLHPDVVDMIEEIKRKLERQYTIKVSREEIVEEAIKQACEDFQKNQESRKLVIQFTRKPGNLKTRKQVSQETGNLALDSNLNASSIIVLLLTKKTVSTLKEKKPL